MLLRIGLLVLTLASATAIGVWAYPRDGHCAVCAVGPCTDSSACFDGCFCAKRMGEAQGFCAGAD
jgi:hypothetical protein